MSAAQEYVPAPSPGSRHVLTPATQSLPVTPRISVVMPAYQAGGCIGAAISSVLSQTVRDVELIVVDDGSTDHTASVARAFGASVRLVQQDNLGVGAARRRGIAEASGELIAFCDADDILFATHLEALVEVWERHDRKPIVTSNAWYLFPSGIERSRQRQKGRFPAPRQQRRAILEQNFVSTMSLFRASLVDEIGSFNPALHRAEDWEFWAKAVFAGHHVVLQPRPLAMVRWSTTGLTSAVDQMDASVLEVLRQMERRADLTGEERSYIRRRLTGPSPGELCRNANEALLQRRYADAAGLAKEAAELQPSDQVLRWKSRLLRAGPRLTGPLVRARQARIDRSVGL